MYYSHLAERLGGFYFSGENMKFEWEPIDPYHKRVAVPGGWLVKAYEDVYQDRGNGEGMERGWNFNVTMTFIADEGHYWRIDK